jgi:hypothetical protein
MFSRASFDRGRITIGDLLNSFPFRNTFGTAAIFPLNFAPLQYFYLFLQKLPPVLWGTGGHRTRIVNKTILFVI